MIDGRHEELACLHALDLLEGEERSRFEQEVAHSANLQTLVRELRDTSTALTHLAPASTPPAELKSRVFATLASHPSAMDVIRPSTLLFRRIFPWAIAAGLALSTLWFAQLSLARRTEADLLRSRAELTEVELQSSRQQFETEGFVLRRQLANLGQEVSAAQARLAETQSQLAERERRIALLSDELRTQADLSALKITALASMLNNSPKALAVAVWNPVSQAGVLQVEKLPALRPDQDYQLWVVDPQYPNPVDGGVFTVDPETGEARLRFKAKQSVGAVKAFAVTLERKGGVPKAEGPFVLLGQ